MDVKLFARQEQIQKEKSLISVDSTTSAQH